MSIYMGINIGGNIRIKKHTYPKRE